MATIAGGSISSISGGKFASGAVTAAMAYTFDQMQQEGEQQGSRGAINVAREHTDRYTVGYPTNYEVDPTSVCAIGYGWSSGMDYPVGSGRWDGRTLILTSSWRGPNKPCVWDGEY